MVSLAKVRMGGGRRFVWPDGISPGYPQQMFYGAMLSSDILAGDRLNVTISTEPYDNTII